MGSRTAASKTFGNPDGSFTTEVYPYPVYYQDSRGNWKEIVNDIKPSRASGFAFENTANRFKVSFASDASGKPVRIALGNQAVSFGLVQAQVAQGIVQGNSITYPEVYPGVDLRLTVEVDRVKEELVLKQPPAVSSFPFELALTGLTAQAEQDGSVGFYSENGRVMYIPRPFMYDSAAGGGKAGARSDDIGMALVATESGAALTLSPDVLWLTDPARVYPVIIDPTIVMQPGPEDGKDSFLRSDSPDANFGDNWSIYVGRPSGAGPRRGVIQFDLSTFPDDATISSAKLHLHLFQRYGTAQTLTINLHRLTASWDEMGVAWNYRDWPSPQWASPGGDYDATVSGSFTIDASIQADYWFTPAITSLVQDWVNGTQPNYGILMKLADEGIEGTNYDFDTSDYTSNQPRLEVTYTKADDTDGAGLEPYYGAISWDLGASATLYAALTSKRDVVLTKDLLSIPGRGVNLSLALTYNRRADLSCNATNTGSNWHLSIPMLQYFDTGIVEVRDEDGSLHRFKNRTDQGDGTYKYQSPPGMRFTLVEDTNTGKFILKHDDGLAHEFSLTQNIGDGSPAYRRIIKSYDSHHTSNYVTYNYNGEGYISSISDSSDTPRSITLTWGDQGCSGSKVLTRITDPAGMNIDLGYQNNSGELYLASIIEAVGITGLQRTTSFAYEAYSPSVPYARLTSITDPRNNTTAIEYDSNYSDKRVKRITDVLGNSTNFSYHDNFNGNENRVYIEDARGSIVRWDLVGPGRNNPGAIYTANLYNGSFERGDAGGGPDKWSFTAGTGGSGARDTTEKYAGAASAKTSSTSSSGISYWAMCVYCQPRRFYGVPGVTYTGRAWLKLDNVQGTSGVFVRLSYYNETTQAWQYVDSPTYTGTSGWIEISTPDLVLPSTSPTGQMYLYLYLYQATGTIWWDMARVESRARASTWDANLMTASTDGNNLTTTYTYGGDASSNPSGNPNNLVEVTDHLGNKTTFKYDLEDHVIEIKRPKHQGTNKKTTYTFDSNHDLIRTVDEAGNTWEYTYHSPYGLVATLKDPNGSAGNEANPTGLTYDYTYNGYGLLTDIYIPKDSSSPKLHIVMAYDNLRGLMTERIDAKGQKTCFEYDQLYRLKKVTYLCQTPDAYSVEYAYDANDNRTQMKDVRGGQQKTTTYQYNAANLLTRITEPDGRYTTYTYDATWDLTDLRNVDGQVAEYRYDTNRRIFRVYNPYDAQFTDVRHDNAGRPLWIKYPGGTRMDYSYKDSGGVDQGDRLMKLEISRGGSVLKSFSYLYDANGNVTRNTENDGSVTEYTYSDIDQLTSASRSGSNAYSQSFTYDPNGNRKTLVEGGTTYSYTYNAANWMLSESDGTNTKSFSYDNNGNMTSEGANISYTYNGNDRLISASVEGNSLSYVYDGDNRRVSITSSTATTTHYYSPLGVVLEQQNGVDHAKYVRSWRSEPISISGPDGVFYYLYDGSGNVVGIIDSSGAADWYSYQPFGEDLSMPGSPRYNPFRYAGTYRDQESGGQYRYYMIARYHDPAYGRFSQIDPIRIPQDFVYVANNPLIFVDPSGLCHRWYQRLKCMEEELKKKAKEHVPVILIGEGVTLVHTGATLVRLAANIPPSTPATAAGRTFAMATGAAMMGAGGFFVKLGTTMLLPSNRSPIGGGGGRVAFQ